MNATTTEDMTGLNDEIIDSLRRALDLFQEKIDAEVRNGADASFLRYSEDSPVRDIVAAQAWLARVTHQIHREHVMAEEEAR